MRRFVLSLTIVDANCDAIISGTLSKELNASLPVDQMYNAQRDAHYMIEEAFRRLEQKDDNCIGGQSGQAIKPSDPISGENQGTDPDYLRHGDEGPIRSPENHS